MSHIRRLDHVGITVADLDAATASFADHQPGSPTATANELGLRSICFEVDGLQPIVDPVAANGYGLVGGIG